MLRSLSHRLTLVTLLALATTLQAQSAPRAATNDPLDARVAVPSVAYESSLSQYKALTDEQVISWREANETVNRIGGWRAYAREANDPDPAPVGKPPTTSGRTK